MSIAAPFHPVTNNYAIEAEIRVLGVKGCSSFGFVGRAVAGFGEQMGINFCECHCAGLWDRDDVPKYYFDPGWSWHTYRLELNGTLIKFSIDNKEVITAADDRFISPGSIGLWCDQMAIHVRTFAVYALSDK
jgi:hypothetical protein